MRGAKKVYFAGSLEFYRRLKEQFESRYGGIRRRNKMKERVEASLNKIRPALQADGGDIELVDVTPDGVVKVKLTGACGCCPMSQMTLKMDIEKILKKEVPEVKEVVAV